MKEEALQKRFEEIAGALTAHAFLLENMLALMFANREDPLDACARAAKHSLQQFEDLPARQDRAAPAEEGWRIYQHGLHRLERLWAGVDARLQSHLQAVSQSGK